MYGPPIYITVDERKKVYSTDFSFDPALEKQRDIFVFQCLVGCRISDLYRMTKRSIIDGAVEYMPRRAKDGNPVVVRVPLLTATKEILDKYKDLPAICTKMSRTLTWPVPLPVTKKAAKPSIVTA